MKNEGKDSSMVTTDDHQYESKIRKLRGWKKFARVLKVIGLILFALLSFLFANWCTDCEKGGCRGDGGLGDALAVMFSGILAIFILQSLSIPMLIWRSADIKEDRMRMCRLEANGNEEGESGGDNRGEMFSTADKALLCIIGFGCMTGTILFGILYFVRGWHGMEVPPRFMIPVFAFGVCILLGVWRNKIDILLSCFNILICILWAVVLGMMVFSHEIVRHEPVTLKMVLEFLLGLVPAGICILLSALVIHKARVSSHLKEALRLKGKSKDSKPSCEIKEGSNPSVIEGEDGVEDSVEVQVSN